MMRLHGVTESDRTERLNWLVWRELFLIIRGWDTLFHNFKWIQQSVSHDHVYFFPLGRFLGEQWFRGQWPSHADGQSTPRQHRHHFFQVTTPRRFILTLTHPSIKCWPLKYSLEQERDFHRAVFLISGFRVGPTKWILWMDSTIKIGLIQVGVPN